MDIRRRFLVLSMLFLLMIILSTSVFAGLPLRGCAANIGQGTNYEGDENEWLCIDVDQDTEGCFVTENGNVRSGSYMRDVVRGYEGHILDYVEGTLGESIQDHEAEGAARYMAEQFYSGPDGCTTKKSFNTEDLHTALDRTGWSDVQWDEEDMKGVRDQLPKWPNLIQCTSGFEGDAFIQRIEGEGSNEYDIWYCDGDSWLDEGDLMSQYDEDNDGVPALPHSGTFSFDCEADNPNVFVDSTLFGFTENTPSEICGDNVDNICLNSGFYDGDYFERYDDTQDWVAQYEGETWDEDSDDCHMNPVACESNCLWSGNKCDYLSLGPESITYEYNVDTNGDGETNELDEPSGFSAEAISDPQPGFCCGAGGFSRVGANRGALGDIQYWDGGNAEYACLHTSSEVVPQIDQVELPDTCPQGDWCWISESLKPLQIFTIKTLGQPSYDIIAEGDSAGFTMCNSLDDVGQYSVGVDHENSIGMNRMACFSQGENFAIAECALNTETGESLLIQNKGAAQRVVGDGVFALPTPTGDGSTWTSNLQATVNGGYSYLDLNTPAGTSFLQTIDFTGYDFLEFFVTYTNEDIILPENIQLIVRGLPKDSETLEEVRYYDNHVLGYAVNSPLLETGNTIHVKVPVGDWLDVSSVTVATLQGSNTIEVKNLYLSKLGEEPLICSGVDLSRGSNWLIDLDESDSETRVNGENICISRYGENAWLGYYEGASGGLEVEARYASCCGNDPDEYYSGKSLRNQYGCFDSEPIANGQTAMTVQYTVESSVQDSVLSPVQFDIIVDQQYYPQSVSVEAYQEDSENDLSGEFATPLDFYQAYLDGEVEEYSYALIYDPVGVYQIQEVFRDFQNIYTLNSDNSFSVLDQFRFDVSTFAYGDDVVEIELSARCAPTVDPEKGQFCIDYFDSQSVQLFTPHNQRITRNLRLSRTNMPNNLVVQLVGGVDGITSELVTGTETETYTYPCLSSECVFALPGLPTYYITNEHPDLYEMYFVGEIDGVEQEILITEDRQEFDVVGVLKVKDISQQVLFEYDEEDDTGTFYGCNAVYYIDSLQYDSGSPVLEENYGYCSVQGEFYCGYSDSNFLVSSWSNIGLSQVGYAELEEIPEDLRDLELELYEASYAANELSHATSVVPGRNFVPNMDFDAKEGSDILRWELLDSSNAQVSDELFFVDDDEFGTGVFEIESGYTLRSSRISLAQNEYYSYQDASSCSSVSLSLVNKDGEETVVSSSQWSYFPSADAVYLRIEVAGPCEFSYPYLQLVDELGASEGYVGRSAEELEELGEELGPADGGYDQRYSDRAGAACCPDGMCWNGYACVGNMALNTYMIEDTGKDSYYRCIEGDWTHLEPQYDWNNDQFGFCESSTQCFVTSSLSEGASSEATVSDFYSGSYPTCVNDGEYLLDHYCDAGEWTSRTKFIASQLLSFAETDDYVLYCSHFEDAFVDYDKSDYNYVNYLAGEVSTETSGTSSLGDTLSGTSSVGSQTEVCFSALENSETGRRLVSQDENTCINSVCVLKYRQGDDFVAAFGASMNLEADDEQSFLIPLGIGVSELDSFCSTGSSSGSGLGNFISCSEEIWYASELSSIIYAKDGISISSSIVDRILDWFSGLFDGGSSERSEDFLDEARNFNKLYLADVGDYTVRAVSEKVGDQETISVEYDGFDWPLCDFINNAPDEFVYRYQWPASPEELVDCELTQEGVYRVMTASHSEYWWPEFTSSLRIEANN